MRGSGRDVAACRCLCPFITPGRAESQPPPNRLKWVPPHPPNAISAKKSSAQAPETAQSGYPDTRPSPFHTNSAHPTPQNHPKWVPPHPPNAIRGSIHNNVMACGRKMPFEGRKTAENVRSPSHCSGNECDGLRIVRSHARAAHTHTHARQTAYFAYFRSEIGPAHGVSGTGRADSTFTSGKCLAGIVLGLNGNFSARIFSYATMSSSCCSVRSMSS